MLRMGGKTKQTPRTKNNAKPSSSSRSAELLGTTVPTFVGFSAHSRRVIVPIAPGLASADHMPDTFDPSINSQFQLILRKLSKKDPMTKKKALQDFIETIKDCDNDIIKNILPIWPKYYSNLSNDPEPIVRELTQIVLQLLISRSKHAIRPYLKQLVPTWMSCQFDNYAPAASVATKCFLTTFATTSKGTQEVCLLCQSEILEFTTRNLTFHTPETMPSGKTLTPQESEQKYQRAVVSSLKTLSFFVKSTATAVEESKISGGFQLLLGNQKFMSFAKNNLPAIRAAWFELIYHVLQSPLLIDVASNQKALLIVTTFQNIDETEALPAPYVWGCILLLQSNFDDWYLPLNSKKMLTKLSCLLRDGFYQNAQRICPSILPFFAKITQESLQGANLYEFYKRFFDDMKLLIITSQEDIIIKTYFECFRFLLQKFNNDTRMPMEVTFVHNLVVENFLDPVCLVLQNNGPAPKHFFMQTSALVSFWDREKTRNKSLYEKVLKMFWTRLSDLVSEMLKNSDVNEHFLNSILELAQNLRNGNPSLEIQKVTFVDEFELPIEQTKLIAVDFSGKKASTIAIASFIQMELKELVLQLVRFCLSKLDKVKSPYYVTILRRLTKMYADSAFYKKLTNEESLYCTLSQFINLIEGLNMECCETILTIVFEILEQLHKIERFDFIETTILKLTQANLQTVVLHRLLSHPLCIEPKILEMLASRETSVNIIRIAKKAVADNDKEKFNLLHKCFFQTKVGGILINKTTVDEILLIISEPLKLTKLSNATDICGSFLSQIMPVICNNNNSSKQTQNEIFTRLFQFSLFYLPNDYISEDTLWEITTCWQDVLSSQDICVDDIMLAKCAEIIDTQELSMPFNIATIDIMSEAIVKFIMCSTEHIKDEDQRLTRIDQMLLVLFTSKNKTSKTVQEIGEFCLYLEGLKAKVSIDVDFAEEKISAPANINCLLQCTALHFTTLLRLRCNGNSHNSRKQISECNQNQNIIIDWSELQLMELQRTITIAAMGDELNNMSFSNASEFKEITYYLSEKLRTFMRKTTKIVEKIKDRLLQAAVSETSIDAARSLLYLVHCDQFAQYEESATILFHEYLEGILITQEAYKSYIHVVQYLLPQLKQRTITMSSAIMQTLPKDVRMKAVAFRILILNNFNGQMNETSDKNIIISALQFITDISEKQTLQKGLLLYNTGIYEQNFFDVITTVEYINLLNEVLQRFPYELSMKNWDTLRVGISSWVLSISKSIENFNNPKIAFFIVSVCKLFSTLVDFIRGEKQKSSTVNSKNIIEEWENLFAPDVNIVLFESLCFLTNKQLTSNEHDLCVQCLIEEIAVTLEHLDYKFLYTFCKTSTKLSMDNFCIYFLRNLSNNLHCVRFNSMYALREISEFFVADDIEKFNKKSETFDPRIQSTKWHYLNRFVDYISRYFLPIRKYLDEFSFKLTELEELEPMDKNEVLSYLLLWDCIIYACAKSPVALRSVYTNWLVENKYEENFLHLLFRAMPVDILKNQNAKVLSCNVFKELSWNDLKDKNLSLERYVCHLYTVILRKLPAVVRKWWNTSASRQKNFVDNLTTHYVSALICNEELKAIAAKKEKHENMQIAVHTSTREVFAVYSIDEARMELVISLAENYPLGAVKVECGKQLGGRTSSRNVGMQLTIFLTHQNGTIFDGLTLWKNNLDKKFEGVEECYVCYTVIHQDTCQLPKLTCKTCKKKFHGPCLYKWFTTSSKSTCPICRNVF